MRSNGTVTYVGKDMAYQFWKFGLLGEDFHYRLFGDAGKDGPLWATSSVAQATSRRAGRHSAAATRSTTSSTCASPTCRSC